MAKKKSSEAITDKIKRLNILYATNGNKEEIERLKAEVDFFYYGVVV